MDRARSCRRRAATSSPATGNAWPIGYQLKNPGLRRHPAPHRGRGRARILRGPGCRGDRRGGRDGARCAGRHDARRSRGLYGEGAPAGLRRLSRRPRLRHGSALLGRPHGGADDEAHRALRSRRWIGRGAAAVGAASHRGGREARLRRPQPLPRRPRLRHHPRRPARSRLSRPAPRAHRPAAGHGQGEARRAARPRPAVVRARRNDRARRHEPHLDHRRRRQCARHDHDHRRRVRLAQLGGGLPPEQRADRFFLPSRRRRGTPHRQRRRSGQAAAQLHGADDRVRRRAARSSPCSARPAAARSSSMW